jgi:iron complex outermembrane receptor protein
VPNGNRLPTVPKFQAAVTATYGSRFSDNADWYVSASAQHVGSRYTQPGDQEPGAGNFSVIILNGAGFTTAPNSVNLKLPSYNLVNLSAGLEFGSGTEIIGYVNNLFDENPLLSFDRERGGRARLGFNIGQPRTISLTVRQAFRSEPAVAYVAPPPPPPPLPSTQTCPDGSVIAADAMCPAPPPPPPPPPASSAGERG